MRVLLALSLLITLCASASAAAMRHSRRLLHHADLTRCVPIRTQLIYRSSLSFAVFLSGYALSNCSNDDARWLYGFRKITNAIANWDERFHPTESARPKSTSALQSAALLLHRCMSRWWPHLQISEATTSSAENILALN
jgi:hypothetical protein